MKNFKSKSVSICVLLILLSLIFFRRTYSTPPQSEPLTKSDLVSLDVPQGNVERLFDFIQKVPTYRPSISGQAENRARDAACLSAILKALDRIDELDTSVQTAKRTLIERLRAEFRFGLADESRRSDYEKLLAENTQHADAEITAVARAIQLRLCYRDLGYSDLGRHPTPEFIDRIFALAKAHGISEDLMRLISAVNFDLERMNENDLMVDFKRQLVDLLETYPRAFSEFEMEQLQVELRRRTLIGADFLLNGETIDGNTFQWEDYRGHVVVVEFWASWCAPSLRRFKTIRNYLSSHPEYDVQVVGVCLDIAMDDARRCLITNRLPGTHLFSKSESNRGWNHPVAAFYGVKGLPLGLLVNSSGKVVSASRTHSALVEQLATLPLGSEARLAK